MTPFTLGDLEAEAGFKAASLEEQQKVRENFIKDFVFQDAEFMALDDFKRKEVLAGLLGRGPVFKDDTAPEVQTTLQLINKAKAGDRQALQTLAFRPTINSAAKATLVGTVATWTAEKVHDLLDPDNKASEVSFTVGKEAEKLEALVGAELPEIAGASKVGNIIGMAAGFLEIAAIGALSAGTVAAPRGFAKPIATGLKGLADGMRGGVLERMTRSLALETANAVGSAIGFSIKDLLTNLIQSDQQISVENVAKRFGEDVAFDFMIYYGFGALKNFTKLMHKQVFHGSYAEAAAKDILKGGLLPSDEGIMQALSVGGINPRVADELRLDKIRLKNPIGTRSGNLEVVAKAMGFNVDIFDEAVGPATVRRYVLKDAIDDKVVTGAMSFAEADDFLASFTKSRSKGLRIMPQQKLNLNQMTRIAIDPKTAQPTDNLRTVWLAGKTDDPDWHTIRFDHFNNAHGLGLRMRKFSNLFAAPASALGPDAPSTLRPRWLEGFQYKASDESLKIASPWLKTPGGAESPALQSWKQKIRVSILKNGVIPFPEKVASADQMRLWTSTVEEALLEKITLTTGLSSREAIGDIAYRWGMQMPKRFSKGAVQPHLVRYESGTLSPFGRADFEAADDLAKLAYGEAVTGGILDNVSIMPVTLIDGSTGWRISQRDATGTWRSIMEGGKTKFYTDLVELRRDAVRKILAEGRISKNQIKELVGVSTGYRLYFPEDSIVKGKGRGSVDMYMLALPTAPTLKGQEVAIDVLAKATTFEKLFAEHPELYDAIADGWRYSKPMRAVWNATSPYFEVSGRVAVGSQADILNFIRFNRDRVMSQSGLEAFGDEIINLEGVQQVSKRVMGSADKTFTFSNRMQRFYFSSVEGGRVWKLTPGTGQFKSLGDVEAFLGSNLWAYMELDKLFAKHDLHMRIMPDGSVGVFDHTRHIATGKSRKDLEEFFEREVFDKVFPANATSDERRMLNEILGAMDDYTFVSRALGEELATQKPYVLPGRAVKKIYSYEEVIMQDGKKMRLPLDRKTAFGWELVGTTGNASQSEIQAILAPRGLKAVFEGDTFRVRVGPGVYAEGVAAELEDVAGLRYIKNSPTMKSFTQHISGEFYGPDGALGDLTDEAKAALGARFKSFYTGHGSSSATLRETLTRKQQLKDASNRLLAFYNMAFSPTTETFETLHRLGVEGSGEMKRLMQTHDLLMQKKRQDLNMLQPEYGAMLKDFSKQELTIMNMIKHLDESLWEQTVKQLDPSIRFTQKFKEALKGSIGVYDKIMQTYGITPNMVNEMSMTNDVTNAVKSLAAQFSSEGVDVERIADLFEKLKNAENAPMILKVFADSMRPDDMFMLFQGTDIKTWLDVVLDKVSTRYYFSKIRDDAIVLFSKMAKAKNEGREVVKGSMEFMMETLDGWLGRNDTTHKILTGAVSELSEALYEKARDIPVLRNLGIDEALRFHDPVGKISSIMTVTTQGGRYWPALRNATQPFLAASILGMPDVLQAYDYVLRNDDYVRMLIGRGRISQGLIEKTIETTPMGRAKSLWLRPVENSEIINRAVVIRAAEQRLEVYAPRYFNGLETKETFLKAIGGSKLYASEQIPLMRLIEAKELDAAADFLGSLFQDITQFRYGQAEMGRVFRGEIGRTFGKFLNQNVSTQALFMRHVRTAMNPGEAVAGVVRLWAAMKAMELAFEKVGIQYDGFGFAQTWDLSGGAPYHLALDTLALTGADDQEDFKRQAKMLKNKTTGLMLPGKYQVGMMKKAKAFADGGRYWDAFLAFGGAPIRTDDQLEFLERYGL